MYITSVYASQDGRVLKFTLTIEERSLTIVNIYAPNEDNPSFFERIFKENSRNADSLIVIGDFNLVMNTSMDRIGSQHNNTKALDMVKTFCEELMLCEVWRGRNEDARRYSWYRAKPKLSASRIDFSIISSSLSDMCENTGYTTGLHTDHLAYYLYFNITNNERGRGYWKLNMWN